MLKKNNSKTSLQADSLQQKQKKYNDQKMVSPRHEAASKMQRSSQYLNQQEKNSRVSPYTELAHRQADKSNQEAEKSGNSSKFSVRQEYRRQEKKTVSSRSKSKEQKDRLTLNLAKFSRKQKSPQPHLQKQGENHKQNAPASVYLDKSNHQPRQQEGQEHSQEVHHEEVAEAAQQMWGKGFLSQHPEQTESFKNRRSMFSDQFESVISQVTAENVEKTNLPERKEPTFVEPKKTENDKQLPSKTLGYSGGQQVGMANSSHSINYPSSKAPEGNIKFIDAPKRISGITTFERGQAFKGQTTNQASLIEELSAKLQKQRQQSASVIGKMQAEKLQLQEANKQLIQAQFSLRNEVEILRVRSIQTGKDQEKVKLISSEEGYQHQKTLLNLEKALKQTESQFSRATQELRKKANQNNQLLLELKEIESSYRDCQNQLILLQNERSTVGRQASIQLKYHQKQLAQLRSSYQFRLKQQALKQNTPSVQLQQLKAIIGEKQKQVKVLKQELSTKEVRIQELVTSVNDSQNSRLSVQLEKKQQEVDSLIEELNYHQRELADLSGKLSRAQKDYQTELTLKQHYIEELQQKLQHNSSSSAQNHFGKEALAQLYSPSPQLYREGSAFLQMQHQQSQEMNKLRNDIGAKNQQLHSIQLQNQELKDRVRTLQQEQQINSRSINSNLANLKQAKEASELVLGREVESLKRKLGSLEMRLSMKEQQIRDKNRFIQQHLLSSIGQREDASILINQLSVLLSAKSSD